MKKKETKHLLDWVPAALTGAMKEVVQKAPPAGESLFHESSRQEARRLRTERKGLHK